MVLGCVRQSLFLPQGCRAHGSRDVGITGLFFQKKEKRAGSSNVAYYEGFPGIRLVSLRGPVDEPASHNPQTQPRSLETTANDLDARTPLNIDAECSLT